MVARTKTEITKLKVQVSDMHRHEGACFAEAASTPILAASSGTTYKHP